MRAPSTARPVATSVTRPRSSPGTCAPTLDANAHAIARSDRAARLDHSFTPASKNMKPVLARTRERDGVSGKAREQRLGVRPAPLPRGVLCGSERGRSPGSRRSGSPSQCANAPVDVEPTWFAGDGRAGACEVSYSGGAAPDSHRLPQA